MDNSYRKAQSPFTAAVLDAFSLVRKPAVCEGGGRG